MRGLRVAALLACAALAGCAARGPLLAPALPAEAARSVELADTPFHPQDRYQCGPAALATVLGASGVPADPETLRPLVYLPARRGSLQVEMLAAPRRFARLAYRLDPDLDAILAELAAGRPVLVLHNYGLPFWPRWHYAVVVGYDAADERLILRSGTTRRQLLSARNFMRAWDNGGRWAMVVLRPGELPAGAEPGRYLESAAAFERGASPADALSAFDAAVKRWPDAPVAWIGRGSAHYRLGDHEAAARDYAQALALDPASAGARNNLAAALLELGCPRRAQALLDALDAAAVPAALRAVVEETRADIAARIAAGADEPAKCAAFGG